MKTRYCLFLIFTLFLFLPKTVFAEGYTTLSVPVANDGSADALNYSQGRVLTIDKFGKFIALVEGRSPSDHRFVWSNNDGTNWTQGSLTQSFLTRGSVAYDSNNDKLHVIWAGDGASDGIIYRRYGITRDGSNNITAIAREDSANINLQLDTSGSRTLSQPVALWMDDGTANGILVATWGKYGGGISEIRGTMRNLSLSAADGVAGNWKAIDGTGDTFGTDPPAVAADKIYTTNAGFVASSAITIPSGTNSSDLYVFYQQSFGNTSGVLGGKKAEYDPVDKDWSTGWSSQINIDTINDSAGYNLKAELISKPVYDSIHQRVFLSWANYLGGGLGDTVSFTHINSDNSVGTKYNVYSANGTHSYAPTHDIAYDSVSDHVYISYIESTTNGSNGSIKYKTFNGQTSTLDSSPSIFYVNNTGSGGEDGSADIPVMYPYRFNDRMHLMFRVNGSLPPTSGNPHISAYGWLDGAEQPEIEFDYADDSGGESFASANIPVSLSNVFTQDVDIDYYVVGGSATSGDDFTLADGTLTIPAGQTTGYIPLVIEDDIDVESDETIQIEIDHPVFASLGVQTTFTYTIEDDEVAPTPTPSPTPSPTAQNSNRNTCDSSRPTHEPQIKSITKIAPNRVKVEFEDISKHVKYYDLKFGFSKDKLSYKRKNIANKDQKSFELTINNLDNINLYMELQNRNGCKNGHWSDTFTYKKPTK